MGGVSTPPTDGPSASVGSGGGPWVQRRRHRVVVPRKYRLLRRWPPLRLRPTEDGRGNIEFVQRGTSATPYVLGGGVVLSGVAAWILWSFPSGMKGPLPVVLAVIGVFCLLWSVLLARSTRSLTVLLNERQVRYRYKLGFYESTIRGPLSLAELRVHRLLLFPSKLWLPGWRGFVVVLAVDRVMVVDRVPVVDKPIEFPLAALKTIRELTEFVQELPATLASLPLVESGDLESWI